MTRVCVERLPQWAQLTVTSARPVLCWVAARMVRVTEDCVREPQLPQ